MQLKGEMSERLQGIPLEDNLKRMFHGTFEQKMHLRAMLYHSSDPRLQVVKRILEEQIYRKVV